MRKLGIVLVIGALGVPGMAQGQEIAATAQVGSAFNYPDQGDLLFGSIDPTGTGAHVHATAGYVQIWFNAASGTAAAVMTELTDPVSSETIQPNYTCAASASVTTPALSACDSNTGHDFTLTGAGNHWVHFGGSIPEAQYTGKPPGDYSGTITVTFTPAT